jgi:antitoxin component HigA of HigAB toxin-antitoxin module
MTYQSLINYHPLKVIRTKKEYVEALALSSKLLAKIDLTGELDQTECEYIDVLNLLIDRYQRCNAIGEIGLGELKMRLTTQPLTTEQLTDIFGNTKQMALTVAGILPLTSIQLVKLGQVYEISPVWFI